MVPERMRLWTQGSESLSPECLRAKAPQVALETARRTRHMAERKTYEEAGIMEVEQTQQGKPQNRVLRMSTVRVVQGRSEVEISNFPGKSINVK